MVLSGGGRGPINSTFGNRADELIRAWPKKLGPKSTGPRVTRGGKGTDEIDGETRLAAAAAAAAADVLVDAFLGEDRPLCTVEVWVASECLVE